MTYGLHTYQRGQALYRADEPFYALIQAAMWKADTQNQAKLRAMWPDVWEELQARYDSTLGGGRLESDGPPPRSPLEDPCVCGHTRADHIYHEGACRPGFVCPDECTEFVLKVEVAQ